MLSFKMKQICTLVSTVQHLLNNAKVIKMLSLYEVIGNDTIILLRLLIYDINIEINIQIMNISYYRNMLIWQD